MSNHWVIHCAESPKCSQLTQDRTLSSWLKFTVMLSHSFWRTSVMLYGPYTHNYLCLIIIYVTVLSVAHKSWRRMILWLVTNTSKRGRWRTFITWLICNRVSIYRYRLKCMLQRGGDRVCNPRFFGLCSILVIVCSKQWGWACVFCDYICLWCDPCIICGFVVVVKRYL